MQGWITKRETAPGAQDPQWAPKEQQIQYMSTANFLLKLDIFLNCITTS